MCFEQTSCDKIIECGTLISLRKHSQTEKTYDDFATINQQSKSACPTQCIAGPIHMKNSATAIYFLHKHPNVTLAFVCNYPIFLCQQAVLLLHNTTRWSYFHRSNCSDFLFPQYSTSKRKIHIHKLCP